MTLWKLLILLASGMWFASWFLPVNSGGGMGGWPPGWDALRVSLAPLWPYRDTTFSGDPLWFNSLGVVSGLTNLAFLGTWLTFLARRASLPWILLLACGVVNTCWLLSGGRSDLRIGYYLWLGSYFVMAGALRAQPARDRIDQ